MVLDAEWDMVRTTHLSENKKQQAFRCEYSRIKVDNNIEHQAGVGWELREQFIAASNGNAPRLTMAFVHAVSQIEHHDVVSSGILTDKYRDKHPHEWTKQASTTLENAAEL